MTQSFRYLSEVYFYIKGGEEYTEPEPHPTPAPPPPPPQVDSILLRFNWLKWVKLLINLKID